MMSPDTILRSDAIEEIYQAYGRPSDDEVFIRMREALERVPWVSPLTFETNSKEYKMPDGKTAVFGYSDDGIGSITLENMDMLMGMLADRPQGEWEIVGKNHPYKRCPFCKRVRAFTDTRFCDWCGARMKGADDD